MTPAMLQWFKNCRIIVLQKLFMFLAVRIYMCNVQMAHSGIPASQSLRSSTSLTQIFVGLFISRAMVQSLLLLVSLHTISPSHRQCLLIQKTTLTTGASVHLPTTVCWLVYLTSQVVEVLLLCT